MAAVNRNMFDASVTTDRPRGASLMVLPLNLIAFIISHLEDPGDLARLCRTCRVLNYMTLPQLYKSITLTSYDRIRYRGDQPEGMGSASPFSMGLNAIITRPYASLVRSLTLRGNWRESELEEHARIGRVTDSSMMLNIVVRAAIDKMNELESFSWDLNTKMLETVYLGLAQQPKLTSLSIRFPSSRHPRPTIVIPAMPHLRRLKITDIDPLCYPDDISTLLWKCKKLQELNMHWSPRMREEQEPSVMVHDYFRKCISAKQPLRVKKIGLQNLYALHTEEFNLAFDQTMVEDVTILTDTKSDDYNFMNTFVDSTWPIAPPHVVRIKSIRQDRFNRRHADFLGNFTGLERLYFVNATPNPNDMRSPRHLEYPAPTPPSVDHNHHNPGSAPAYTPDTTPSCSPGLQAGIRDAYLNNIIINHAATLRHLLLPSYWPLSSNTIARIVHSSPQLEQLSFATEFSSMDTLGYYSHSSTPRPPKASLGLLSSRSADEVFTSALSLADIVEADDDILIEKFSESLADPQVFSQLRFFGFGWKAFELLDYYTIPAVPPPERTVESQSQSPADLMGEEINGCREPYQNGFSQKDDGTAASCILTPAPASHTPPTGPAPRTSQAPSLLGKRRREHDLNPGAPPKKGMSRESPIELSDFNPCLPTTLANGRVWRRRVRRVGWDTVKRYEIWGLDTQEL
ncbi:hypothetical protein ABOM_002957 [Aspergillus bombycis]|uniref:F-box domain-containing protein n=1 Tax=Aspergillus bombycis TaxID=109264 RepID=A0A1F8ABI4_9EURO|nr:hypothetical protein ABOM_002957 [Aspergillus bombycis]OGM48805.1 hypothetical protein ABOM_002957 [Aspergillus bombycis]